MASFFFVIARIFLERKQWNESVYSRVRLDGIPLRWILIESIPQLEYSIYMYNIKSKKIIKFQFPPFLQ